MSAADIFVLLEGKGNSFESVFAEYGYRCQQIAPQALGSPFCPAFRLLIVPAAFTAPQFYTKSCRPWNDARARSGNSSSKAASYSFTGRSTGRSSDTYDYPWLPARFTYRYLPRMQIKVAMPESPIAGFVKPGTDGLRRVFRATMKAMSC